MSVSKSLRSRTCGWACSQRRYWPAGSGRSGMAAALLSASKVSGFSSRYSGLGCAARLRNPERSPAPCGATLSTSMSPTGAAWPPRCVTRSPSPRSLTRSPGAVVVVTLAPAMSWWQVVVLAVVQGLTEFLPVSSSGHLAIVSRIFFADDAGASFTAVSQLGTELAVLVYFARDIWRIVKAWFRGFFKGRHVAAHRDADYRLGWYVIIGTIPICILGLFFKDEIRSGVRNLWVIATALVGFSAVIAVAERLCWQRRHICTLA